MKKPINIILVNHGRFGEELIRSAEMIVGTVSNIEAVSLLKGMSIEELVVMISEKISQYTGEVVILTDLFGGTPSNVAMMLQQKYTLHIACGMNLPMLLELLMLREYGDLSAEDLIDKSLAAGRQAVLKPASIVVEDEFEG